MRTRTLLATGIALIVLLISGVPVSAHDVPEEFDEFDELFDEFAEEFDEILEEFEALADDPEELGAEFPELFEEFAEEFDELVADFTELIAELEEVTTVPVVGVETAISAGPPETFSELGRILHIRGQEAENVFVGICGGDPCTFDVPFTLNVDLNLDTGNGWAFGTFAYVLDGTEFTWGDRIGSFDGPFWGKFDGATGVITLAFPAEGSGDFEGMKLGGTGTVPPPAADTEHPIQAVILAPSKEVEELAEEFADLVEEFDDLVEDFDDFVDEFDDFVAEVLEDPAEFDEEFADLAEEVLEFVEGFDEAFDELAEEFAQFATPAGGTVAVTMGAPTEILFIDGNLIITQPFSLVLTGSVDGTEDGTLRIVITSTGEFILHATGVFTGTVDGKSGTAVDRTVIMGTIGRGIFIGITGDLVNIHELDIPMGDTFTGLTFDL